MYAMSYVPYFRGTTTYSGYNEDANIWGGGGGNENQLLNEIGPHCILIM